MKLVDYIVRIPKGVLLPPKPPFECGDEEIALSVPELVRKYEYPFEAYTDIVTEDNYILNLYRIPHGKTNLYPDKKRPPVLLMHGLLGSSADYVIMGPQRGLAYLLADKGYDVWLGNARGTTSSRKHVELDVEKDKRFWKFSWHEIGIYDLPAIFDFIQKVTGEEKLAYIGMSQGTTVFFVCLSEKPQYNQRISVMIALAPVAYLHHLHSPLPKLLAAYQKYVEGILPKNVAFPPPFIRSGLQIYNRMYSHNKGLFQDTTVKLLFFLLGDDHAQLNEDDVPKIFSKIPDIASARQFLHYGQCIGTEYFRQFDFGQKNNLKKYGTSIPPSYKLENITAPVALCHGKGDWFSRPQDVFRLARELPNCISSYKIPYYLFNHYDFISACDVNILLYDYVFDVLKEYN